MNTTATDPQYHQSITKELAGHDATRACIVALAPIADDAQAVADLFPGMRPDVRCSAVSNGVWLEIHITDMNDLADVRRALTARGMHLHERNDQLDSGYFVLDHHCSGRSGRLLLQVQLPREGASAARCRLVKVGERVVPEYAIQCGEG